MTFITWEHGLADILGPQNHTREEAGCYITCRLGRFLHSTALQCTQGGWLDTLDIDILFTIHIDIL